MKISKQINSSTALSACTSSPQAGKKYNGGVCKAEALALPEKMERNKRVMKNGEKFSPSGFFIYFYYINTLC